MVAAGLAIVAVVTGGAWLYRTQEEYLCRQAETELRSIAHLKADEIAAWRQERLADGFVLMESPFLAEQVARLMASPHPENTKDMLTRFRSLQERYHYSDVLLVDADGQARLRLEGSHGPLSAAAPSVAEALRERRPVLTDIHVGTDELPPHIGVIAPIFAKSGAASEQVGAIILMANVQQFLFPLLQSWPTPSRSAETLLVRRDGDSVLFLNDLRFRKHTALRLRIPLSRKDVPAVMAARGRVGVVRGNDYRGVKVFAALKPIPDSPWFLVAKMDDEEVLAVWRFRSVLILPLTLALVLAAVAAAGVVWQRNDRAHYQSLGRAQAELRESEERYRVIFEGSSHGILMTDSETRRFMYANPSICRMLGYTEKELLQLGVADIHPKDSLDHVASEFEAQARGEKTLASELPCLRKDGTVFYADVTSTLTTIKGGRECTVGFFTDITERRDLSQQLEVAATQIRGLMAQVVTGNSLAGRFSNPSLSRCWEEKKCTKTDCPAHGNTGNLRCWEIAGTFCKGKTQGVFAQKYGDCRLCNVYQSARANPLLELGETFNGMSAILEDRHKELSQAKAELETVNARLEEALLVSNEHALAVEAAKEEIEEKAVELGHQSTHDSLTGLPNRASFESSLGEHTASAVGKKRKVFDVMFMDLDRFKLINDALGHKVGDLLLVAVADRLRSCLRSNDALARMGGDEFTVIVQSGGRRSFTESVAARIIDSISRPFEIEGHKFVIGVSFGLAAYPSDGTDSVTLLKHADSAMYKAKEAGRGTFRWFTGEAEAENRLRADMERDLRHALEDNHFQVHYQPIVRLDDGTLHSAEALLRWDHPEKGMICPSLFIPVAEEIGLINTIGDYVLRTACSQTMAWRDEGMQMSQISVNVSTVQIRDTGWLDSVKAAISDSGLDPRHLVLELTESHFAADYRSLRTSLQKVQRLGIGIAIDDFGMGQSSLSRLKDFAVIELKIDGSFVRDIEYNENDKALLNSIIQMAHDQGIKVTAEWVETEAQANILRSSGCDFAQGFLFSPPLPVDKFRAFALAQTRKRKRRAA